MGLTLLYAAAKVDCFKTGCIEATVIGISQILTLFPGISRFSVTASDLIYCVARLTEKAIVHYSFLLTTLAI